MLVIVPSGILSNQKQSNVEIWTILLKSERGWYYARNYYQ